MVRILPVLLTALSLHLVGSAAPTVVLADNVTTAFARGTLKLKGDADANTLTLDQAGLNSDQIRVTGGPTTIDGSPDDVVFIGGVAGLQVDLGAGDDTLTINLVSLTAAVKIKMGAGADTVAITSSNSDDAVNIDLGGGDNALQFCGGHTGGALTIKVGAGTGAPRNAVCGMHSALGHGSTLVVDSVVVDEGLSLKGSKTTEAITLFDLLVGTNAAIALGGGSDALAICSSPIGKSLKVKMGKGAGTTLAASCGGTATASGDNALDVEGNAIGDAFSAKMGGSDDSVVLAGNNITGATKLDLGQGINDLNFDGTVGDSLTVKSGKDADVVQIKGTIGNNTTVNAGAGNNVITFLPDTTIGDDLTVKTGNGDDTIDVSGSTVGGTTKIKNGKGSDTITMN
jgi:hypothetical protein